MHKHIYNLKRDSVDSRDYRPLKMHLAARFNLLETVNLNANIAIPIQNQLDIGSCTSNAIGYAHAYTQIMQGQKAFVPSRLFHYWNERAKDGNSLSDEGSTLRCGMEVLREFGICDETLWGYDRSNLFAKPTKACYIDAEKHQSVAYYTVPNTIIDIQQVLAGGHPIVLGILIYENFESKQVVKTGIVDMPKGALLGGHAVCIIGYCSASQNFIMRNSWGVAFGNGGYFTVPFEYITKYGSDLWYIANIE